MLPAQCNYVIDAAPSTPAQLHTKRLATPTGRVSIRILKLESSTYQFIAEVQLHPKQV